MKKYQKYEKKRKKFKLGTFFVNDNAKKEVSRSLIFHKIKYFVHVIGTCGSGTSYFLMDEI
jgi:hypothetical protein